MDARSKDQVLSLEKSFMKTGVCKLCLKTKKLCDKSHIIPGFLYKYLYGENKKLVYLHSDQGVSFRYNSEYEGGILCQACDERIIGTFDNYAAKFIYNEFATKIKTQPHLMDGRECFVIEGAPYEYTKFKLFLLSLLWRGSISSRPFFAKMKLNSETEEDLRKMISSNDPGVPEKYACFVHLPSLVVNPDGGKGLSTFYMPTMSPQHVRKDAWEFCEFTIIGTKYYYLISKPKNVKIVPALGRDKLTLTFNKIETQKELMRDIFKIVAEHPRPTLIKPHSGK